MIIVGTKDNLDWYLQSVWFSSPVCIFHLSVWLPLIRETFTCGLQGWGKVNRRSLHEYNMYSVTHLNKNKIFIKSILKRGLFNDPLRIIFTYADITKCQHRYSKFKFYCICTLMLVHYFEVFVNFDLVDDICTCIFWWTRFRFPLLPVNLLSRRIWRPDFFPTSLGDRLCLALTLVTPS